MIQKKGMKCDYIALLKLFNEEKKYERIFEEERH